jgi:hypothetical protein
MLARAQPKITLKFRSSGDFNSAPLPSLLQERAVSNDTTSLAKLATESLQSFPTWTGTGRNPQDVDRDQAITVTQTALAVNMAAALLSYPGDPNLFDL